MKEKLKLFKEIDKQITEKEQQLEKLKQEKAELDKKIDCKNTELTAIGKKIDSLNKEIEHHQLDINHLRSAKKDLKFKKISFTALSIGLAGSLYALGFSFIDNALLISLLGSGTICSLGYYFDTKHEKQFLKEYKVEDLEHKIEEKRQSIDHNSLIKDNIQKEFSELNHQCNDKKTEIKHLNEEISQLYSEKNDLANQIINNELSKQTDIEKTAQPAKKITLKPKVSN